MGVEVGVCGIYCEYCPVYRREEKGCLGCEWVNEQLRLSRKSNKCCAFWKCAKEKNVKCCFLCEEFPCQLHYRNAVYTPEALKMWKELVKKGINLSKE